MVKKNLALISNEHLSKFIINNGQDNSLTFAMRVKNFNVFKFLLQKGISVLLSNNDGKTAVHVAIEFEQFDCLIYLFEGEQMQGSQHYLLEGAHKEIDKNYFSTLSNQQFIWQSLQALDCQTKGLGYTPFHLAVVKGN
jgi:ankyrin repeat protein